MYGSSVSEQKIWVVAIKAVMADKGNIISVKSSCYTVYQRSDVHLYIVTVIYNWTRGLMHLLKFLLWLYIEIIFPLSKIIKRATTKFQNKRIQMNQFSLLPKIDLISDIYML